MPHKRVEFHRPQFLLERETAKYGPGKSLQDIFGKRADLIHAALLLRKAINWSWVQWHLSRDFDLIRKELMFVVERSLRAVPHMKIKDVEDRGFHDQMLMHAAVLSGHRSTAIAAAKEVRLASSRSKAYQYEAAVAGILASRVLDKPKQEQAQLKQFGRFKPTRVDAFPSRSLARAFVEHDDKALAKAIKSGAEKFWSKAHLTPTVVISETKDRLLLDLSRKSSQFLWPYVEATFAKLAIQDGTVIKYDSFWFPLEFIAQF